MANDSSGDIVNRREGLAKMKQNRWARTINSQTWPFGRVIISTLAGAPEMCPCYKLTVVPTMY